MGDDRANPLGVPTADIVAALLAGFIGFFTGFAAVTRWKHTRARREPFCGQCCSQHDGKSESNHEQRRGEEHLAIANQQSVPRNALTLLNPLRLTTGNAGVRHSRASSTHSSSPAMSASILAVSCFAILMTEVTSLRNRKHRLLNISMSHAYPCEYCTESSLHEAQSENEVALEAAAVAAVAFAVGLTLGASLAFCIRVFPADGIPLHETRIMPTEQSGATHRSYENMNDISTPSGLPSSAQPYNSPTKHVDGNTAGYRLPSSARDSAGSDLLTVSAHDDLSAGDSDGMETRRTVTFSTSQKGRSPSLQKARHSASTDMLHANSDVSTSPFTGERDDSAITNSHSFPPMVLAYQPTVNPLLHRFNSVKELISRSAVRQHPDRESSPQESVISNDMEYIPEVMTHELSPQLAPASGLNNGPTQMAFAELTPAVPVGPTVSHTVHTALQPSLPPTSLFDHDHPRKELLFSRNEGHTNAENNGSKDLSVLTVVQQGLEIFEAPPSSHATPTASLPHPEQASSSSESSARLHVKSLGGVPPSPAGASAASHTSITTVTDTVKNPIDWKVALAARRRDMSAAKNQKADIGSDESSKTVTHNASPRAQAKPIKEW